MTPWCHLRRHVLTLRSPYQTLGAGFKGVSSDLWHQLLEFAKSTDENLAGFNEMDAC